MKASHTIGQIIDDQWGYIEQSFNRYEIRHLHAIRCCRTAALGGEVYHCDRCGHQHKRYYSCRNRHCPQCQNTQKLHWINARESQLIHTDYYHVVFTIPHQLNELMLTYQRPLYALLMRVAWQTLDAFGWDGKYLGGQIGCTMVLHTWGANMSYHPHVHCIVPGGGITIKGTWQDAKHGGKFLFPVKAMSKVFQGKFIAKLQAFLQNEGMTLDSQKRSQLYQHKWVVYAKPPFGGAQGVIKYLARYTHKTCITNHRIVRYDAGKVTFKYTDYRHGHCTKTMTLPAREFIRRLVLHLLPKGFSRIRHYGILSSAWKDRIFPDIPSNKTKSTYEEMWKQHGLDVTKCPQCKQGKLIWFGSLDPVRGPPRQYHQQQSNP